MVRESLLDVTVMSPHRILYRGRARRLILPGEKGVFEVLPYHKRFFSRLLSGSVTVGTQRIPIKRGVVKVGLNQVTVIVEEPV